MVNSQSTPGDYDCVKVAMLHCDAVSLTACQLYLG